MNATEDKPAKAGLEELERRVIAMGNMVESLFADSAMALIESSSATVPQMRTEDRRAHERWLEIDKLCVELLTMGDLTAEQVRSVWAAARIAGALKRAADESLRIGESLRSCLAAGAVEATSLASIPRLAALAQSMLGDAIEALANRDAAEAATLRQTFRELTSLSSLATQELTERLTAGEIGMPVGAVCLGVAQRLERIGDEVLDISNQVNHIYRQNQSS